MTDYVLGGHKTTGGQIMIDKIMAEIENACYDYGEMGAGDMNKITKILEKYLPKEEHICEKHLMDSNCPICGMFVAGEKHNEIMDRLIDKDEKI